ncbi:uncharacterized protein BT62DRAFT_938804 [Guyanagaster necrorhizus]|uniref:F-box domain-containing protein n=1 Tax=Guyanagaster necrorhizus TaxID=856835 RepID=A0A9P8ALF0_9AGAR|nr:uncharacterized protein BT62DRAFT_938804 [Guyanagaster necrorhizus MCA 3950]KAG7439581.1 hypothetical protein BT62DRAFT_938804 [Guyanagaster necrorhizus MCA 3950]
MPDWVHFPQELIDAIVNEVHNSRDLKSCSLVSRSFSSRTRALLFHRINLRAIRYVENFVFTKFHEICLSSPQLSASVKILGISKYGKISRSTPPPAGGILDLIIQSLPNLGVITLLDVRMDYFLDGSLACLSSYSFLGIHLNDVVFDNIDQLYELISGSPQLKSLILSRSVLVFNEESQRSAAYLASPQVEDLVLKYDDNPAHRVGSGILESIFRQGGCPFSLERVRRLTINVGHHHKVDFDRANAILAATSQTLQELTVVLNPFSYWPHFRPESPLHILCFGSTRKILFSFIHGFDTTVNLWWCIRNLIHIRDKVGQSTIEELAFEIVADDVAVAIKEWAELDELLSNPPFSDTFRRLRVTIIQHPDLDPTAEAQRADFGSFFPSLSQKGGVSFSLDYSEWKQFFKYREDWRRSDWYSALGFKSMTKVAFYH